MKNSKDSLVALALPAQINSKLYETLLNGTAVSVIIEQKHR